MYESWWPWVLRALWVVLPFVAGPVFAEALDATSRPVQLTASLGLWVGWGLAMALTLIPHTMTLTPFRVLAPACPALTIWAVLADGVSGWAVAALSLTAVITLTALAPATGAWFVNGSSYGDEVRAPLRPPGPLVVGPIPLFWAVLVCGLVSAPMLFAARQWVLATVALLVGLPLAAVAARSLHSLARRWLVFVPAGMVIHDHLALADPVLFKRGAVRSLGPALEGTDARDLSQGALGLALELRLRNAVDIAWVEDPRSTPTTESLAAVVISASQPGRVLETARLRRIPVG